MLQMPISDETHVVGVWFISDPTRFTTRADFARLLTSDERLRATRFLHTSDRDAYVAARCAVRLLASRQLQCDPRDIIIGIDALGKPFVEQHSCTARFSFSISHSRGRVMLATSCSGPVGIDLQWMDPSVDVQKLARAFFREEEADYLDTLPQQQRVRTFYSLWVRKEAYLKALGTGLANGLRGTPRWIRTGDASGPADTDRVWSVAEIRSFPTSQAAVCAMDPMAIETPRELLADRRAGANPESLA
jgi:phosphopantetheinyl transferase